MFETPGLVEQINIVSDIIPRYLMGKIFWMVRAISFSEYSNVFGDWVVNIKEEMQIDFSQFNYFTALLNLGDSIGKVKSWRGNPELEHVFIKSILQSCLLVNGGPNLKSKTRIFYWLEKWMQFSGVMIDATAEKLLKQAWGSVKQ